MEDHVSAMNPPAEPHFSKKKRSLTKGEAKRQDVMCAAARLFRDKGYHATSMQDIADAVGLQKGSLYYHVANKEDLLFQVMDRAVSAALDDLEAICSRKLPASEKLRRAIHSLVEALALQGERVSVLLRELNSLPPVQVKVITSKRKRYEMLFREILDEGNHQGVFRIEDTKIASCALLGMCNWIHQWYEPAGKLSPTEIGHMFTHLFLRGCLDGTSRRHRRTKAEKLSLGQRLGEEAVPTG